MGRRDGVQVVLEIVAECRRLLPGLVVSYEPAWERRGNGTLANYEGGIVHHTASPSSLARPFPTQGILRDGRSDLPGPLCNFAGPACTPEQPRLHVMAANPANHAGASGGRSMGPLPRTSLFNPRVVGLEIDYAGTVPMLLGQLFVGKAWTRAVANVLAGGNVEAVRAHMETSVTGKWDIGYAPGRTYDMASWRRDAATLRAGAVPAPRPAQIPEEDMPLNDADLAKVRDAASDGIANRIILGSKDKNPVYTWQILRDLYNHQRAESVAMAGLQAAVKELSLAIAKQAGGEQVDQDALVERIGARVDSAVADAAKLVKVQVSVDDADAAS